ncbi:MAG: AAA family ATPase [Leptospiraceae bacterium]|nr:AAA family ATPase [Leptospiraceae bacterium]MBK9501471.1 AAA family ATPase [Leptospiraceae bacterium]MBP9889251.1 AAA family ATPase [Leptospiraceae bacterium]
MIEVEELGVIRKVKLDDLILDPNNFRFVDDERYVKIEDKAKYADSDIQLRIQSILLGDKKENVQDLTRSFLSNGLLEHDYIQVTFLENIGKYLVTEGNRRTAFLKYIKSEYESKHIDLGKLDKKYLFEKELPVAVHNSVSPEKSLIMMGLQHVTRKKPWPAYNQALMIEELLKVEPYKSKPEMVSEELGISSRQFNQSRKTLFLINQFIRLGYKNDFKADKYNYFLEIIRSPDLRNWIGWDEYSYEAKNLDNLHRLFSYFLEGGADIKDRNSDEDDEYEESNSYHSGKALIRDSKHLRDLARIISNPKKLEQFERTGEFPRREEEIPDKVKELNQVILELETQRESLTQEELYEISGGSEKLTLISKSKQFFLPVLYKENDKKELYIQGKDTKHFSELFIKNYKKFKNLELKNLNRINIFAGKNNAGKTTLLEAILLLANQNNYRAIFEIIMKRAKHVESTAETFSLVIQALHKLVEIEGNIDGKHTKVSYHSEKEIEDGIVKSNLLKVFSEYNSDRQSVQVQIQAFGYIKELANIGNNRKLVRSVYSSPFSASHSELVEACHSMSLNSFEKNGEKFIAKDKIIGFIQKYVDTKIRYIEMDQKNFKVTHEELDTMFLWEYGEGLQRIFYISLLFAYAENGIVCIDEFENAVYFGLLTKFTELIQYLAVEFNVQVFLTTHSKECVDAFILNDYRTEDISAYTLLPKKDGTVTSFYYSGNDLKGYIEDMNTDVRTFL